METLLLSSRLAKVYFKRGANGFGAHDDIDDAVLNR
jgi:hypothetical protein